MSMCSHEMEHHRNIFTPLARIHQTRSNMLGVLDVLDEEFKGFYDKTISQVI
jgi:hypothetical protein